MGRVYSISFTGVSVTAQQDLFELLAPATTGIRLHALYLAQDGSTTSAELRVSIKRVTGSPTTGSGGSTPTPVAIDGNGPASAITAKANNTTRLSGGTSATIHVDTFNALSGYMFMPPVDMRPSAAPSTRLMVGLETTSTQTLSGVAYVEEIS